VTNYPSQFSGFSLQDTTSLDSSDLNATIVVRTGTIDYANSGDAGYSTDFGKNYKKFPNYPVKSNYPLGGEIAISADTKTIIWRPFLEYPYYTVDRGQSWKRSIGAPKSNSSCCRDSPNLGIDEAYPIELAADRVNPLKFYIYAAGQISVSEDGGANWSNRSVIPGYKFGYHVTLKPLPNNDGEVWVSSDWGGLWRSTDSGRTWNKLAKIDRSVLFSFGAHKDGSSVPALYVMGRIDAKDGILASFDLGSTWQNIQDLNMPIGDNPWAMCADQVVFGRVYIGTLGRGIYYSQPQ